MIVPNYDNSYDKITKWEVDRKNIQLIIKVGAGNFGDVRDCSFQIVLFFNQLILKVYCGRWNKLEVAIKTMKPGTMEPKSFIK